MDTKLLNKIVTSQIQQYGKRTVYYDQAGLIPEGKDNVAPENQ